MKWQLVIDSGATKTHWAIVALRRHSFTLGINANYTADAEIAALIREFLAANADVSAEDCTRIAFYGAGCGNVANAQRLRALFQQFFPAATNHITVASDLLAACHALCGKEAGLVAILGTGAASCLYDGAKMVAQAPSLGYMLGDEGSGTHLGKQLITAVLLNQLPTDLQQSFNDEFHFERQDIIKRIYQNSYPNRFFASFAPFLSKHREHDFVRHLCTTAFADFFDKQILYYPDYQQFSVNFVGSVAFFFQDLLRDVARTKAITIGSVLQSPMERLLAFHCL